MPNFPITKLVETLNPTLDTVIPCVQGGVTKQITILQLKQYLNDGTVKTVSSGEGIRATPTPITSNGQLDFYAPGMIALYGGNNAPSGWVLCDGSSYNYVSDPSFNDLFVAIGYTHTPGILNGPEFKVPNLQGRTVFGKGDAGFTNVPGRITTFDTTVIGTLSGDRQTTLNQNQTPLVSHTHTVSGQFNPSSGPDRYGNNTSLYDGTPRRNFSTETGAVSVTLTMSIPQSSEPLNVPAVLPHPNLPPFLILNWIIKK